MPTLPSKSRHELETKEQEDADSAVPSPRSEASLGLKIVQHPGQVFYKDEGGKANHLVVTLCVQNLASAEKIQIGGALSIEPKLCYENGRDVEDGAEIFKVLSIEPKCVSSTDDKVTCKFRIEKVSRRKDGQRFKVRFDANVDGSQADVASVFTSPVCVLSKRKSTVLGERRNNNIDTSNIKVKSTSPVKRIKPVSNGGRTRGASMSVTKGELQFEELIAMRKAMSDMGKKIDTLVKRVGFLEDQNTFLRETINKRGRTDALCYPERVKREKLAHTTDNAKLKLDHADTEILACIVDDVEPARGGFLKRAASSDVTFNFGLPSASFDTTFWFD